MPSAVATAHRYVRATFMNRMLHDSLPRSRRPTAAARVNPDNDAKFKDLGAIEHYFAEFEPLMKP